MKFNLTGKKLKPSGNTKKTLPAPIKTISTEQSYLIIKQYVISLN